MGSGVGVVVRRLRARQGEIEDAIFAAVREAVPESTGAPDSEYVEGLRVAVGAAVEFGLKGIAPGEGTPSRIPREAVAQARRAARSGVSLEAVLRRYIVGHALLWDYVMEEADRLQRTGRSSGLREMSRAQAALLDQLVIGVTREHVAELQRAGRSREQRVLERVRILLAGELAERDGDRGAADVDLDYELDGEHLGVIAWGAGCEATLHVLAGELDRRLLCVPHREGIVWAWLGGRRALRVVDFERALSVQVDPAGVTRGETGSCLGDAFFVAGEPGGGLEGWRLTHRQAQAALLVAQRRPRSLTCYADVALLAAALSDETLARSLVEIYLSPLEDSRGGGAVLRETLHAYIAAERNASSAAVALNVARTTVVNRLRMIEERLGRTLQSCPAQLEVALDLDELSAPADPGNTTTGLDFI
jgi:hypothetical protein